MRALIVAGLLAVCAAERAGASDVVTVESRRRDEALEVVCRVLLDAPVELIWQTLTDYGRLAEFIPGMRKSRIVSRSGAVTIIEQSGEVRLLFFTYPLEVTLSSIERPPHVIEATLLRGNLKRLDGVYRIAPQGGGRVLLSWTGVVEAHSMPPLIGEIVMRASIEDQFRGMVEEILRRDALRREREQERKQ
jgi:ribosome-associated toxin RatA of RatAB toxin-antitoxin module